MRIEHRRQLIATAAALTVGAILAPAAWSATITLDGNPGSNSANSVPTFSSTAQKVYDRLYKLGGNQGTLIDPISNLFNTAPDVTRESSAPVTYSSARLAAIGSRNDNPNDGAYGTVALNAATTNGNQNNLMVLQTDRFNFTSAGTYTFGTRSDDGSVVYIDLDNDGVFNSTNERIVNNNFNQGYTSRMGTVNIPSAGDYSVAIGYYQGGCCDGNGLEVRYGTGNVADYETLSVLDPTAPVAGTTIGSLVPNNDHLGDTLAITGGVNDFTVLSAPATYGALTMTDGSTLKTHGPALTANSFTGTGNISVVNDNGLNLPSGLGSGVTALNKSGAGTMTVGASSSSNANVSITGGRLAANADGALGTGPVSVNGGQLFLGASNSGSNPLSLNGDFGGNGALRVESGGNVTYAGPVSLTGNAMIGTTNGTNLHLTAGVNNNGNQIRIGGGSETSIDNVGISGNGGLNKTEGGQLFINAVSGYNGTTDVNGGTFNANAGLPNTGGININNNATFNANAAINAAANLNISNGTYNVNGGGNLPNTAVTGPGTIKVNRSGNIGGGTVGVGGLLHFAPGGGNTATFAGNAVNVVGGTVRVENGTADLSGATITGSPVTTVIGNTIAGRLWAGKSDIDPNNDIQGVLSAANPKLSVMTAPNHVSFNNDTEVDTFFGAPLTGIGVENPGNWTATFEGVFTAPVTGTYTFAVAQHDDNNAIYVDANQNGYGQDDRVVATGCCSDANTKTTGTVNLTAGQSYNFVVANLDGGGGGYLSGMYALPGSALKYFGPSETGGGADVNIDGGAKLIAGALSTVTNVNLGGDQSKLFVTGPGGISTVTNLKTSSGTSQIDIASTHQFTVQGLTVANTSTLLKSGGGKLLVDGAGSGTGLLQVSDGALGGHGSVAGPVQIMSGGTLAPGNSIGTLGTGALSLDAGSTYAVEIDGTLVDLTTVAGGTTLGGGNLSLSLLSSPIDGHAYTIIDGTAAVTGLFAQGASITAGSFQFDINYAGGDGNDVILTAHAVPEPASLSVLGLAAGCLLARRRRGA